MGLIHTRASKKRDKAAARLASDQSKVIERQARRAHQDEKQEKLADRQEAAQGKPWPCGSQHRAGRRPVSPGAGGVPYIPWQAGRIAAYHAS